jgi:hypothetical protein
MISPEQDEDEERVARIVRGKITTTLIKVSPIMQTWEMWALPLIPQPQRNTIPNKVWCVFELLGLNLTRNQWKALLIYDRNWWPTQNEAIVADSQVEIKVYAGTSVEDMERLADLAVKTYRRTCKRLQATKEDTNA